ncbi:MAG: SAM-dependent methyltransferase [Burkholderiaceae bacterium]|jgi:SAM-dependent MidA family methyltransferase|nr:SAM-dependent methyltransferase [Burkholderiales bacterium]MCZ8337516.1 SAM-dependent methyltransferase [Burkholderiaceae bacterium]
MTLPPPGPDALAHSGALAERIADAIRAAGGWIGFDAWMARALYEPGLGYYAGPARPFGAAGDFVTAPELSPLFAECVAVQLSQWFGHASPEVIEFGAGTGRLAAGVLGALRELGTPARRYAIVEVSGALRARQRETIAREAPWALEAVEWLDALPASIDGVVLGNEVLDAMPVRVWEHEAGVLRELGVALDADDGFAWAALPADTALREAVARSLRAADDAHLADDSDDTDADAGPGPGDADPFARLGPGRYRSELGEQAAAWVATVGRALRRGAMLLVDYGFPAREYYHPQRDGGTLIAHRRHHAHGDVLRWPGLQDVTAHVDFSAVARAARGAGLVPLGYASQARFLLNCGVLDRLAADARDASLDPARVRALGAVQTLLSEAEMGELFKAIAFGRGVPDDAIGFARGDRRGAL